MVDPANAGDRSSHSARPRHDKQAQVAPYQILDLLFYEMAFTGTENHLPAEVPSFAVCSCQQQLS
jgi:hypothetical protein